MEEEKAYESVLNEFLSGLQSLKTSQLLKKDEVCKMVEADYSKNIDALHESLSPQQKALFKELDVSIGKWSSYWCDKMYLQGYIDCIRFLKVIGLL